MPEITDLFDRLLILEPNWITNQPALLTQISCVGGHLFMALATEALII